MPTYTVPDLIADLSAMTTEAMKYIIPAACLIAGVAFLVRWFMYAIDLGRHAFGSIR